jgi:hypothetical protein
MATLSASDGRAIPDSECLALPFVVVTAVGTTNDRKGT